MNPRGKARTADRVFVNATTVATAVRPRFLLFSFFAFLFLSSLIFSFSRFFFSLSLRRDLTYRLEMKPALKRRRR